MDDYSIIGRISEGAHGIVFKARHSRTGTIVALKRVQLRKVENGIPNSALREIKTLQVIDSENVVQLLDVFPHGCGFVLVLEFVLSDLAEILRSCSVDAGQTKRYMLMLLRGVAHCHAIGIVHRDLKPANLLISSNGQLKIADFGLARILESPSHEETPDRLYSHQVATRWYRAPELLYGSRKYDEGVDLWAIGCIFGEILNHAPLFPGENDIDQLCIVMRTLGTPTEETWPASAIYLFLDNKFMGLAALPDYNKITFPATDSVPMEDVVPDAGTEAVSLLGHLLTYHSDRRSRASEALRHPYFFTTPLPSSLADMPAPAESRLGTQLSADPHMMAMSTLTKSNLLRQRLQGRLPDPHLLEPFANVFANSEQNEH